MATIWDNGFGGYAVALGIGLLVGAERERRKGEGPNRSAFGIRSFAVVALTGAVVAGLTMPLLLGVAGLAVAALAVAGYLQSADEDPGVTTEIAWILTFLLGVLASTQPTLAAGCGALLALLLASRSWLHHFIREQLTERESLDIALLAAAALIALPLLPDRAIDPWNAVNLQLVGRLTVIVLFINAAGYVALRVFGSKVGLPLTGFIGGFVSSTATIASLGKIARRSSASERGAIAGATLSSLPTVLLLGAILSVTNADLLAKLWPALAATATVALAYAAFFLRRAFAAAAPEPLAIGRAFDLRHALLVSGTITVVLAVGGWWARDFGALSALASIATAGFADVHAAAASAAALLRAGHLSADTALIALIAAFASNTVAKIIAGSLIGGRRYALRIAPGLMLMLAAFALTAWPWK